MSRGGAREGAGRKGLSYEEKLAIGSECQQRWNELAQRSYREQWEALPDVKDIMSEQARTQMIPVKLRGRPSQITKETLIDVHESIDEILGGKSRLVVGGKIKRPYGSRPQLIKDVIAWVNERYNRHVSPSQVRESWKAYNDFRRDRLKSTQS